MNRALTADRRSICTLTGMAIGFRAFYAVVVDGGQMYGSRWIALLIALILALPLALLLIPIRRRAADVDAAEALNGAVGKWGAKLVGALLFAVLVYDAAASLRILCSTAKYVAMPEGNSMIIQGVTALAAVIAALMGTAAVANGAVLWRRLMAVLIVLLVVTQIPSFRAAWLTPLLGPGLGALAEEALPAAGMFGFAAAGFLMLEPERDKGGTALARTCLLSGLVTAALALVFCMLVPGLREEPLSRSFRLGRLLANDRAGLSLEMPYVVLLYSGMLTMLLFEVTAAARAAQIVVPSVKSGICVITVGVLAYAMAAAGLAEREWVARISPWYYPAVAVPIGAAGCAAWIRGRKGGGAA